MFVCAAAVWLASLAAATAQSQVAVNITWAEFTDAKCRVPLGKPAGEVRPLGKCGVVPMSDPNAMWRGSSYLFERCTSAGEPAVVLDRVFSDSKCTKPFTNWTLSLHTMDCQLVPPGPKTSAPRGPPIWHSVIDISCVSVPV